MITRFSERLRTKIEKGNTVSYSFNLDTLLIKVSMHTPSFMQEMDGYSLLDKSHYNWSWAH